MLIGHSPKTLLLLAATSLLALGGCAQPGPILSTRTTFGALKTSLSHLEYENQQLRAKVAKLESQNREIEDRLVQEESINGDLTARLDDARNLLNQSGLDSGDSSGMTRRDGSRSPGEGSESTTRALPAGQSNRKPRKPPFARIPGRIDAAPPTEDIPDDASSRLRIPRSDAFGPQGWRDDDVQWLPIARGTKEPAPNSKVR